MNSFHFQIYWIIFWYLRWYECHGKWKYFRKYNENGCLLIQQENHIFYNNRLSLSIHLSVLSAECRVPRTGKLHSKILLFSIRTVNREIVTIIIFSGDHKKKNETKEIFSDLQINSAVEGFDAANGKGCNLLKNTNEISNCEESRALTTSSFGYCFAFFLPLFASVVGCVSVFCTKRYIVTVG